MTALLSLIIIFSLQNIDIKLFTSTLEMTSLFLCQRTIRIVFYDILQTASLQM